MPQIITHLISLCFCLLTGTAISLALPHISKEHLSLLNQLPFIFCSLAAFVALLANNSRPLAAAAAMLLIYSLIRMYLQAPLSTEPTGQIFALMSMGIPILLGVLVILPNTNWRHLGFLVLIAFISIFGLIIISLFHWHPLWFLDLFPDFNTKTLLGLNISITASALFLLAFSANLFIPLLKQEELDSSLLGCILFSFITMAWFQHPYISATMFSMAGLLLIMNQTHGLLNMVYRDELTQIPNRRALLRDIRNTGNHYVLAMVDIDHFKKINDQYGHDLGDQVLKAVAAQLHHVGGGGKAYRFGGEEFCLFFKDKTPDQVLGYLETLRSDIAEYDMTVRDKKHRPWAQNTGEKKRGATLRKGSIRTTVSMGVSDTSLSLDFHTVLKNADKAMYRAKEGGRNQIKVG